MNFRVCVESSQARDSCVWLEALDFLIHTYTQQAFWQHNWVDPMELKWACSCPRFWAIPGCLMCGHMGKLFPLRGLLGQHDFPCQVL